MSQTPKKKEETEIHEGFVVPAGSAVKPQRRNLEEDGVEPQDSLDALSKCRNNACGMELMKGVDRCPYCNTKQK